MKSGNAQAHLGYLHVQIKAAVDATLAALFLLFIFTFEVGKSCKNSIDYAGDTGYHSNDNFHYHASPLQSSIPARSR